MFGFSQRCPVCKMAIKKGKGVEKFGKVFCSEVHKNRRFLACRKAKLFVQLRERV